MDVNISKYSISGVTSAGSIVECITFVLKISAITFDEDFDVLITVTEINMIDYYH